MDAPCAASAGLARRDNDAQGVAGLGGAGEDTRADAMVRLAEDGVRCLVEGTFVQQNSKAPLPFLGSSRARRRASPSLSFEEAVALAADAGQYLAEFFHQAGEATDAPNFAS